MRENLHSIDSLSGLYKRFKGRGAGSGEEKALHYWLWDIPELRRVADTLASECRPPPETPHGELSAISRNSSGTCLSTAKSASL